LSGEYRLAECRSVNVSVCDARSVRAQKQIEIFGRRRRDRRAQKYSRKPPSMHRKESPTMMVGFYARLERRPNEASVMWANKK
jgi:hypothetical protein